MNAVAQKRVAQLQGLYLGLLYPTEEHGVYGYITNTKIKLVVVTAGDIEPSDNAVKQFLHQFHKLYIDTVCNPFHILGSPLTSHRYVPAPMPWRMRLSFRGVQSPCLCANFGTASSVHPALVMQVCHQPRTPAERHTGLIRRAVTINALLGAALQCSTAVILTVHYTLGLLKGRCNCRNESPSALVLSSVALRFFADRTARDSVPAVCANLASSAPIHSGGCDTRWSPQACLCFLCSESASVIFLRDAHEA